VIDTEEKESLSKEDMLKLISNARGIDVINAEQAKEMRLKLGVLPSDFTKKKISNKKKKAKRTAQKKARKASRK